MASTPTPRYIWRMIIDHLLLNKGAIVEDILLAQLDLADHTFSLGDDDPSLIEESLKADGQLDPIVVRRQGDKWQVVDGARRVEAATHLGWERISARLFDALSDEEAARYATRNAVTHLPQPDALRALGQRLGGDATHVTEEAAERFARRSDVAVEEHAPAQVAPARVEPPVAVKAEAAEWEEAEAEGDEEVTVEELADRTVQQLSGISQDLALLQENWADLDPVQRQTLRDLVRYTADLLPYLEEP